MKLKPCPVCGQRPLMLSEFEVMCINRECPVHAVVTKLEYWNCRAEVIGRDKQILKEIILEHSIMNNIDRIKTRFPGIEG